MRRNPIGRPVLQDSWKVRTAGSFATEKTLKPYPRVLL
jgi:hypothetical protein